MGFGLATKWSTAVSALAGPIMLLLVAGLPGSVAVAQRGPENPTANSTTPPAVSPVYREIQDPQSGARWRLYANPENPAGPGRLVLGGAGRIRKQDSPQVAVIHSGDRIALEERTKVAEGRLEAVALGTASAGGSFSARLTVLGKVVRAVALAPGKAALLP